jgi:hypothetical protein
MHQPKNMCRVLIDRREKVAFIHERLLLHIKLLRPVILFTIKMSRDFYSTLVIVYSISSAFLWNGKTTLYWLLTL